MRSPCIIATCKQRAHGFGYCTSHLRRLRKYGSVMADIPLKRMSREPAERFWEKVDRRNDDECWLWTGTRMSSGYGTLRVGDTRGYLAHRFAYELLVGPIPDGLHLDHTCHSDDLSCAGGPTCIHRACVNPSHLEPVTCAENVRRGRPKSQYGTRNHNGRKTHCPRGHPYDEANTYRFPDGRRSCRACSAIWRAAR